MCFELKTKQCRVESFSSEWLDKFLSICKRRIGKEDTEECMKKLCNCERELFDFVKDIKDFFCNEEEELCYTTGAGIYARLLEIGKTVDDNVDVKFYWVDKNGNIYTCFKIEKLLDSLENGLKFSIAYSDGTSTDLMKITEPVKVESKEVSYVKNILGTRNWVKKISAFSIPEVEGKGVVESGEEFGIMVRKTGNELKIMFYPCNKDFKKAVIDFFIYYHPGGSCVSFYPGTHCTCKNDDGSLNEEILKPLSFYSSETIPIYSSSTGTLFAYIKKYYGKEAKAVIAIEYNESWIFEPASTSQALSKCLSSNAKLIEKYITKKGGKEVRFFMCSLKNGEYCFVPFKLSEIKGSGGEVAIHLWLYDEKLTQSIPASLSEECRNYIKNVETLEEKDLATSTRSANPSRRAFT